MKDQVIPPVKSIELIPPRKNVTSIKTGQLIAVKKRDNSPKVLLPPVAEEYIKAREHDFL